MTIHEYLLYLSNSGFVPNSILDIGANVGDFSVFCKQIWQSSYILMIEGNENCEEDLIRTNIPYKIALLGNENKTVNFFINKNNLKCTGCSYYKEVTRHYEDPIIVEKNLIRLDDLVDGVFDIIKIDTQGSELDILKGGLNIVKKSKYIILEIPIIEYNQGSPSYDDILNYMKSIGFSSNEIIENHIWPDNDFNNFKTGDIFQVDIIFNNFIV